MQEVTVLYKKTTKKYNYDHKTTVKQLIDRVRADNKIGNPNFSAKLNGTKLDGKKLIWSLGIKEGTIIHVYPESPASDPAPKVKRICIPRRTDIDTEMTAPSDIEERIQDLAALFPPGQVPDRETIYTALENSYWNLDRAVDYLFPPNEKPESTLTPEEKKDIIDLTKTGKGYSPETAIQVYFACDKNLEIAKNIIQTIELDP